MADPVRSSLSRSAVGPLSRSAIGRATGRLSRRFASATSVRRAGTFLRRQIWAWPLIAAVILGGAGWLVHSSVERAMRTQREAELSTIRDADVEALRIWMVEQGRNADQLADDDRLRVPLVELLAMPTTGAESERGLIQAKAQQSLRARLGP